MNKKQVQQRVLKDGEPLSMDLFNWDEKTNTFSSSVWGLVLGFEGISGCTFDTWADCTFNTWADCTFNTGAYCTFDTGYGCTFTCKEQCVVVRRDVYEIIEVPKDTTIKLNGYSIKGYEEVNRKYKLIFEGKEVEISKDSAINLGLIGK